jgi:hypothetical protein
MNLTNHLASDLADFESRTPTRHPSRASTTGHNLITRRYNLRRFDRLDALHKPGITEDEFLLMFVKCAYCALVMTRNAYFAHECDEVVRADEETEEDEEV